MKIFLTIAGWLLWTWGEFMMKKDEYDDLNQKFPLSEYCSKHWDNWVWNAIVAVVLLAVGQPILHIVNVSDSIDMESLGTDDLYLLVSGFIGQAVIFAWKKWIKKKKTEL